MTRPHPRPQQARGAWTSLNGAWGYALDTDDVGMRDRWWATSAAFARQITIPFPPESASSGIESDGGPVHWYRREIPVTPPPDGRRTFLHLEAVDYESDIWVNEQHVAHHVGGSTPIRVDVTHALVPTGRQVVVVRARDDQHDLEQPRGKQDWQDQPHVIWYRRTSGIWREVWLEEVAAIHVESVRWDTNPLHGVVDAVVEVAGTQPGDASVWVGATLSLDGAELSAATTRVVAGRATVRLVLREAAGNATLEDLWWSPEHPILLDARVTVTVEHQIVDAVTSNVGLRSVDTDHNAFLLNGRPYFLRLVLEQGYWPTSHLAAPSDDALRAEAQVIKDLGFNGLRMHQTTADPRFLAHCDEIGLLVWVDAPASFRFTERSLVRTVTEWTEIVARDRNHPSVCAWVPFNESWGVEQLADDARQQDAVAAVHHLLKALDGSRPTLGNDGWEYLLGDIVGVHDYRHDPQALTETYEDAPGSALGTRVSGRRVVLPDNASQALARSKPWVLSEFGGFTLAGGDGAWEGYGAVQDSDELLQRLGALLHAATTARGLAGFCYTQLTDTEQERNGLLTADRKPKADIAAIAALISQTRFGDPSGAV